MAFYMETGSFDPTWNLAFEEYVLHNFTRGDILILWQNDRSVIIGRNQNTLQEINPSFVEKHGIKVVRRNTGGGAVFHDLGNLNYSFITDAVESDPLYAEKFVKPIISALQGLGLNAGASGRNDILVEDKKVSGTARQIVKGRILHHGTLLFDTDTDMLCGALNPDESKFTSKGVKSIRSRVGSIRKALSRDMEMDAFIDYIRTALGTANMQPLTLSPADLSGIEALQKEKYAIWDWNYGHSPKFDMRCKRRFPGGTLDIHACIKSGIIDSIRIYGDYLSASDVAQLEALLCGCFLNEQALYARLECIDLAPYLGSITSAEFVSTLLNIQ